MNRRKDPFEERAGLGFVDGFCRRSKNNAEPAKGAAKELVVALVPGEAAKAIDDDGVDLVTPLAACLQEAVEFGPIPCLRALALLSEDLNHFHPFALTVGAAHLLLSLQAQIVDLSRVRDAEVKKCPPHAGAPVTRSTSDSAST
ncbi:MAG: hypothetical protein ISQ11_12395 [Planctomycetes bacterium]|nr:hypothetical protein [Planctomycetota bacterium]